MIDRADSSMEAQRCKSLKTPPALTLDEESLAFLAALSDGRPPLIDAFYGQFLDSLPPIRLKDLMRHKPAA